MKKQNLLSASEQESFLLILKGRFEQNMARHNNIKWEDVENKLKNHPEKVWSLFQMDETYGEPDVIDFNAEEKVYIFADCCIESPRDRRSLCYDKKAWEERKDNRPINNVVDVATEMGVALMSEAQYRHLQTLGKFDLKTSSWIKTPENIRKLGGAIFGDRRYDTVFTYHNGASSYYAARGFRAVVEI